MCSVSSDLMVNLLNFSQDVTNSSNKLNKKQTYGKVNKTKTLSVIRASKELVPFTQLVKVRRGQLVLALPNIRFS